MIPDPQSYRWLIGEFMRHATELAVRDMVSPGVLMNIKRKPKCVMPARRELAHRMREGYRQKQVGDTTFFSGTNPTHPYVLDSIPLSYPNIAKLFGGHYSSIIFMGKRAALQEQQNG